MVGLFLAEAKNGILQIEQAEDDLFGLGLEV